MKTKLFIAFFFYSLISSAQFLHFDDSDLPAKSGILPLSSDKWYSLRAPEESFKLFKSNVFLFQTNEVNIYSELVSDKIGVFLVSLGTHINSSKETTLEKQTVETLFNGGGNAVLNAVTTFGFYKNSFSTRCFAFSPKIGFQLPQLGSLTDKATFNAQLGGQFYLDFFSATDKLRLFTIISASQIIGSDDLYENLGLEKKSFFLSQINMGILIDKKWRFMATYPLASTYGSLVRKPVSIGTQILID